MLNVVFYFEVSPKCQSNFMLCSVAGTIGHKYRLQIWIHTHTYCIQSQTADVHMNESFELTVRYHTFGAGRLLHLDN